MFSLGMLIGIAGLLTFLAGGAMYYGRLLERLDVEPAEASVDAPGHATSPDDIVAEVTEAEAPDGADNGTGPIVEQVAATPLLEVVELTRVSPGRHLPDRLQEKSLGRYSSQIQAILKIEATRQRYRAAGETRDVWFYIRDTETTRPVWYVEGLANTPNVIDLREASAIRA